MKQVLKIARVASWDGWCSPCEREDRPLSLTVNGPAGLRSWLTGNDHEDRCLVLTCRVCGEWQVVPWNEQDDPEVVAVEDDAPGAVAALLHDARPADPPAAEVSVEVVDPVAQARLRAAVEAELRAAAADEAPEVPAAEVPAAEVPAPRDADLIVLRGLVQSAPVLPPRAPAAEQSIARVTVPRPRSAVPTPAPTSIALPSSTVLDMLAAGHQVVLAQAG